MTPEDLCIEDKHLTVAVEAAQKAVDIHQQYVDNVTDVEYKTGRDFRTKVDLEAEEAVRTILDQQYPEYSVLGEEDGLDTTGDSDRTWFVDPLDGTVNYFHGMPPSCSIIGLAVDGDLEVSVVVDSWTGDCYYAVAGEGAYQNQTPLQVSSTTALDEALLNMGMPPSLLREDDAAPFEMILRVLGESHGTRDRVCGGMNTASIGRGGYDALVEFGAEPWDVAGALIVREAGGRVTTLDGSGAWEDIKSGWIIMSNGEVHDELLEAWHNANAVV